MEVDVIPFLDYVVGLLGVVVTAVITIVGKKLNDRYKLEIEYRHREVLQEALGLGVMFAVNRARAVYKDSPPIKVRNEVVGTAFNYVTKAVPDALKKFGIDASLASKSKTLLSSLVSNISTILFCPSTVDASIPNFLRASGTALVT